MISYLDPVFATTLAYIVLGQTPGTTTLVGASMIIAARDPNKHRNTIGRVY